MLYVMKRGVQVISLVCIAVWAINIGHFNDPAHGGSWLKVRSCHQRPETLNDRNCCQSVCLSVRWSVGLSVPFPYLKTVCFRAAENARTLIENTVLEVERTGELAVLPLKVDNLECLQNK